MFGTQPFGKPFGMTSFAPDDEEDAPSPVMPGGLPSMPGVQQPQLGPQFNAPPVHDQGSGMFGAPPPRKPSFLGEGGAGRGIAGAIGDFLLQRAGASPIYAPQMQHLQEQAAQRQLALTKAQMERDAEARKINYSGGIFWRQGPDGRPIKVGEGEESPDGLDRALEGAGIKKGTPQYAAAMADRVGTLTNPIHQSMVLDPVTHQPIMVSFDRHGPVGSPGAAGGSQSIPPEAWEYLKQHPETLPHFIEMFHVNPVQGGPTPQGSGTFR